MTYPLEPLHRHRQQYLDAADRQHEQAVALLAQDPADYSAAATACHRALQFERQAEALQALLPELELVQP